MLVASFYSITTRSKKLKKMVLLYIAIIIITSSSTNSNIVSNSSSSNDHDHDDDKITHAHASIDYCHHEIKLLYYTKILLLGLYTLIQNTIVLIILLFLIWLPFPLLLLYAMYQVIHDNCKVILKHDNNYKA